jgi:hypothetical protein
LIFRFAESGLAGSFGDEKSFPSDEWESLFPGLGWEWDMCELLFVP